MPTPSPQPPPHPASASSSRALPTVRRRTQGADRPRGARVRGRPARPRTGRVDPVRSPGRLRHRLLRGQEPALGRALRRNLAVSAVMVAVVRLVLAVAPPADRVDTAADGRVGDRPASRAPGVRDSGRERTVSVTRRDLVLAIWALVVLVDLHYAYGQSLNVLIAVCLVLPLVLAASRASRHAGAGRAGAPATPVPPRGAAAPGPGPRHLAVLPVAGRRRGRGRHALRTALALLDHAQFGLMIAAFAGGLVLLAALALVPRRRVSPAINLVVALVLGLPRPAARRHLHRHPPKRWCSTRPWPASGSS